MGMECELKCSDCGGQIRAGELHLITGKLDDGTIVRRWICAQCWRFWRNGGDVELTDDDDDDDESEETE